MNQLMLQGTGGRSGIAQPVTEQMNAPTVNSTGSYPVIGGFNANVNQCVPDKNGYFRSKWLKKLINFLHDRAD